MPGAISKTSPLLYLHRLGTLDWLSTLFTEVLLDDGLARRTATGAGLRAMGTLGILLEVKKVGLIPKVEPYVERLDEAGMWISTEIKRRVLALAGEP